jgi:hypothetical protein
MLEGISTANLFRYADIPNHTLYEGADLGVTIGVRQLAELHSLLFPV